MLIADQEAGLLVDISLVRGETPSFYTPSLKDLIMVTGILTSVQVGSFYASIERRRRHS